MIRVYKTKAGQNRFIQLFFSKLNVAIGISVLLSTPIGFSDLDFNLKVIFVLIIFAIVFTIATLSIDGQPFVKVVHSWLVFTLSPKKYNQSTLANMSQYYYSIKVDKSGNGRDLVVTKDQIIAVVQIIPIDVSILNEQKKEDFKRNMAKFLHAIGDHKSIQLKVVNRLATPKDYSNHFNDLITEARNKQASKMVTSLIDEYITNLKFKVNNEKVPFKDYFLLVPMWIGSKPSPKILADYTKELDRKVNNLTNILSQNEIQTIRLSGADLKTFMDSEIKRF